MKTIWDDATIPVADKVAVLKRTARVITASLEGVYGKGRLAAIVKGKRNMSKGKGKGKGGRKGC